MNTTIISYNVATIRFIANRYGLTITNTGEPIGLYKAYTLAIRLRRRIGLVDELVIPLDELSELVYWDQEMRS